MRANEKVAISLFLQHPSKKVLLLYGHSISHLLLELVQHVQSQNMPVYTFDTSQPANIHTQLETIPVEQPSVFIFDVIELENYYINYRLEQWRAKVIILCDKAMLHPTLGSNIYFAPIDNGRVQKQFYSEIEIQKTLPSEKRKLEAMTTIAPPQPEIKPRPPVNLHDHFLNKKLMTKDLVMMQMLADQALADESFAKTLLQLMYASRDDENMKIAAANAITSLVYAKFCFSGMDLKGIRIPYADLSGMTAHRTNFTGVDFTGCQFHNAFLADSCFEDSNFQDADFGELPYIDWPTGVVTKVRFLRDGKYIAASGDPNNIQIFEVENNACVRTFSQHKQRILGMDVSPDGEYLVSSCGRDKTIRLWHIDTGRSIVLADLKKNDERLDITYSEYFPVVFSPDGKFIAYAEEHMLGSYKICLMTVPDMSSSRLAGRQHVLCQGMGHVGEIRFNSSGTILGFSYSNGYHRFDTEIWQINNEDLPESKLLKNLKGYWFAFSSEDTLLALATINEENKDIVEIYRLSDFSHEKTYLAHAQAAHSANYSQGTIRDLQFLPSKNRLILASCGDDGLIFLWDVAADSLEPLTYISGHSCPVTSIDFSADGKFLISGSGALSLIGPSSGDCKICLRDINLYLVSSRKIEAHKGQGQSLIVSAANQLVISSDNNNLMKCWWLRNGMLLQSVESPSEEESKNNRYVKSMCLLPSENPSAPKEQLLTVSGFSEINTILVESSKLSNATKLQLVDERILVVAISPDKQWLALGNMTEVRVVNWVERKLIYVHKAHALSLAFSPDSKLLAVADGSELTIIECSSGSVVFYPPNQKINNSSGKGAVHFSSLNTNLLAYATNRVIMGKREGVVQVWNIVEKKLVTEFNVNSEYIECIACIHGDQYIVVGDSAGELSIWDINKKEKLDSVQTNPLNKRVWDIKFLDRETFYTLQHDGSIKSWKLIFDKNNRKVQILLQWGTINALNATGATFRKVNNLQKRFGLLLKQKSAHVEDNNQDKIDILLQMAELAVRSRNFPIADRFYSEALDLDPGYAPSLLSRGRYYYLIDRYKDAERDLTLAINKSTSPRHKKVAYLYRACVYDECNCTEQAYDDAVQAKNIEITSDEDKELNSKVEALFEKFSEKKRVENVFNYAQHNYHLFLNVFKPSDVGLFDKIGLPLLHSAVGSKNVETTRALLSSGADPCLKSKDEFENTALHLAIGRKVGMVIIQMLVGANRNVLNVFNKRGNTPLHFAANMEQPELTRYLLEAGANPNASVLGSTPVPLIYAIQHMDVHSIQAFLEYGADPAYTSSMGSTPLSYVDGKVASYLRESSCLTATRLAEGQIIQLLKFRDVAHLLVQAHQHFGQEIEEDISSITQLERLLRRHNIVSPLPTLAPQVSSIVPSITTDDVSNDPFERLGLFMSARRRRDEEDRRSDGRENALRDRLLQQLLSTVDDDREEEDRDDEEVEADTSRAEPPGSRCNPS